MESFATAGTITIRMLKERLLGIVRGRIANGEYTERGLARILGISQSQIHNVLKGARALHVELADRMLAKLGLSAQQLLDPGELKAGLTLQTEFHHWSVVEDAFAEAASPERERLRRLRKPVAADPIKADRRAG